MFSSVGLFGKRMRSKEKNKSLQGHLSVKDVNTHCKKKLSAIASKKLSTYKIAKNCFFFKYNLKINYLINFDQN